MVRSNRRLVTYAGVPASYNRVDLSEPGVGPPALQRGIGVRMLEGLEAAARSRFTWPGPQNTMSGFIAPAQDGPSGTMKSGIPDGRVRRGHPAAARGGKLARLRIDI